MTTAGAVSGSSVGSAVAASVTVGSGLPTGALTYNGQAINYQSAILTYTE